MTTFTIVIPAKNEASSVNSLISDIFALDKQGQLTEGSSFSLKEVILVNDGSDDDTKQEAELAGAKVVSHSYSKGNGAAIKTGAREAESDCILFMDADGQHQPSEIAKLLVAFENGYDLVVGARTDASQASVGRKWANKFYNRFATYMTGHEVKDLTSGFRLFNRAKFLEFIHLLPNGFSYPTTSTMAFFRAGYSVKYVEITAKQRSGESHIQPLKDGIRFLLIIFKIGTLYSPLKLFVPISASVFLTGLCYYGYTFYTASRFTNMSALMFTTALVIFMVGLVSEQITTLTYKKN